MTDNPNPDLAAELAAIGTRHRVGAYGWVPDGKGVNFFRVTEPLRILAEGGNNVSYGRVLFDDILSNVDTIVAHSVHSERDSEAWQSLARLQSHRLVIDVDDWVWAPDFAPMRSGWTLPNVERLLANVAAAHVVTTPSSTIAEYLHRYNPNVWIVPNTVPAALLEHTMPKRSYPVVGAQCSDSHIGDFTQPVLRSLGRFLARHEDWHVHSYGGIKLEVAGAEARTHHTGWQDLQTYWSTVSMDVGIGPLRDTPFNRGKSSLRAIEYAALGIVAVLPDLPIYRGWVEDGVTGRLYGPGRTLGSVLHEIVNPITRRRMALEARKRAYGWTTEANIGRWLEAWHSR